MTDPKLPDLPSPCDDAIAKAQVNGNGARMRTDVELTGQYLLTVVDDSNERWSRPEWVSFTITKMACLFLVVGGVWLYFKTDLPDEAKVLASSLSMAAGFRLIEQSAGAANKRPNGGGNGK